MDRTLIILKPDCVQRGLIGTIITRFECKGLKIVGLKLSRITPRLAQEHYAVHQGKPFYDSLVRFVTSGPVVLMVLEGNNIVEVSRKMMGATFGFKADPGTIRGDLGVSSALNLIHGSDSPETAKVEIARFFNPDELLEFSRTMDSWTYDLSSGLPQ
ncbi:MAG: nucleoside-diphosphate kinase [Planctomycetes bacterium]|jgi:nucleoside-diphosphate kinase|nr:nucleoside-diphosphate kinase [Planctomycetota bacterium]